MCFLTNEPHKVDGMYAYNDLQSFSQGITTQSHSRPYVTHRSTSQMNCFNPFSRFCVISLFAFATRAPEIQRFKPNLNASVICNEDLFACFNTETLTKMAGNATNAMRIRR